MIKDSQRSFPPSGAMQKGQIFCRIVQTPDGYGIGMLNALMR